jgi:hypothetical protein
MYNKSTPCGGSRRGGAADSGGIHRDRSGTQRPACPRVAHACGGSAAQDSTRVSSRQAGGLRHLVLHPPPTAYNGPVRRDGEYFGDRELVLIYIAKRLKHALQIESFLTAAGVDYAVEPDRYAGGIIFRSERVGAFFYVLPDAVEAGRRVLVENGYKPQETLE